MVLEGKVQKIYCISKQFKETTLSILIPPQSQKKLPNFHPRLEKAELILTALNKCVLTGLKEGESSETCEIPTQQSPGAHCSQARP